MERTTNLPAHAPKAQTDGKGIKTFAVEAIEKTPEMYKRIKHLHYICSNMLKRFEENEIVTAKKFREHIGDILDCVQTCLNVEKPETLYTQEAMRYLESYYREV